MLSILKLKTPRRIALYLIQNGDSTFDSVLSQFEFTKSALSFHLRKLLVAGIVKENRSSSRTTYEVTNVDEVVRIIITYRATFLDNVVDSFIDSWLQI